jgi:hypothetical protein
LTSQLISFIVSIRYHEADRKYLSQAFSIRNCLYGGVTQFLADAFNAFRELFDLARRREHAIGIGKIAVLDIKSVPALI